MPAKAITIPSSYGYRAADIDRKMLNEEERSLEISFSSEAEVDRGFGIEILSHAPGAMVIGRVEGKGALLREHDTNQQVGVIKRIWSEDKKGRSVVRFSKSPLGQQEFEDVKDEIRTLVSVGYRIFPDSITVIEEREGRPVYKVNRWEVLELSTVAIPADASVGYGRSHKHDEQITIDMKTLLRDKAGADGGGGTGTATAGTASATSAQTIQAAQGPDMVREALEIMELAETYKMPVAEARSFVKDGKTSSDFQRHILKSRFNAREVGHIDTDVGMTDKEVKQYSLVRAIRLRAEGKPLDGIEKEASDAVATNTRKTPEGFFVPSDVTRRSFANQHDLTQAQMLTLLVGMQRLLAASSTRALNATTPSAGGYTIGTDLLTGSMIELLRNNMVVNSLGPTTLSGLVGDIAIPKQSGGATAYWLGETQSVTESQQEFGQLALTPKRVGAFTRYTKQLLAQSSLDIEGFVRNDLMTVLAIKLDLAAINGSGVGGQPLGILNTTGVSSITYGAAPTWAKVVENETTLGTANALGLGVPAFLSSYAVQGDWKTTQKATNYPEYLLQDGLANGYRFAATTQMPSGDKTIFGAFRELILASWDGIDVVVNPYTDDVSQQVRVVIHMLVDQGIRHPVAFVVSTDSAAQ